MEFTIMSDHAKFSPSGAERWLKCGYSIKMAPFYKNTDNAASLNGTKHHNIAAMHLENDTEPKDGKMRIYTNAVRQSAMDGELFIERKVIIVPELCEGTLDAGVIAIDRSWARIFDLKWGTSAVHATDNPQEKLYLLGLLREFPMPPDTPVTLTIVQPNGSSGWPIKNWDTNVGHILKFKDKVDAAIENGLKPNPAAVAGSHCFWCPAKIHCKAYLMSKGKK
jgi:hypothetical protein